MTDIIVDITVSPSTMGAPVKTLRQTWHYHKPTDLRRMAIDVGTNGLFFNHNYYPPHRILTIHFEDVLLNQEGRKPAMPPKVKKHSSATIRSRKKK